MDNPYRMTEAELRRTTGHAPGQELTETEAPLEVPHDLPLRVTPMSPATEIAAFGQFSRSPRKKAAKIAALSFLAFLLSGLAVTAYTTHRAASGPDDSVAQACALLDLPHETAADWDAIDARGRTVFLGGAFRNTAANRAVFTAAARLSSLAALEAQTLRSTQRFPDAGPFNAQQARADLVHACRR